MKKVKYLFKDFKHALNNLKNGLNQAQDDLDIDGVIKRFEICYELAWKLIKEYLEGVGIVCKNPRYCFKEAFSNALIDNELVWMNMIEDRNMLVHIYTAKGTRKIFKAIKSRYLGSLTHLHQILNKEIKKA